VRAAGVYFLDVFSGEELFIMDIGLSRIPNQVAYATRSIALGRFWMTGGAGLPKVTCSSPGSCSLKESLPGTRERP
jgi:hypothetical protein